MARLGDVRRGAARTRRDKAGEAGFGVAWPGMVRSGKGRRGRPGMVVRGMARPSEARQGRQGWVRYGAARRGNARQARLVLATEEMGRAKLKAHRRKLGLSLAQAAAQVHVAPRTWARWESGERHVPDSVVHLFCLLNKLPFKPEKKR